MTSQNPILELWATTTAFGNVYDDYVKRFDFNYNELACFYSLYVFGECTQKQICNEWALPKQTVNTLCKSFITQGLIKIVPHTGDKREKLMTLTDKGQEIAKPMIEPLLEIEKQAIVNFGNERSLNLVKEFQAFQENFLKTFKHSIGA